MRTKMFYKYDLDSSIGVKTIKVQSARKGRQILISKYKKVKKALYEANLTILVMNKKLIDSKKFDHFYSLCKKYLTPNLLNMVKLQMIDKREPRG